ncbi:MAG: lipopolysaccharide kinase InaA family protein [Planctomycetota bacterium]|nr:lipopolysaccharide kinase InaA family protein [Planctomycetota bacterium]
MAELSKVGPRADRRVVSQHHDRVVYEMGDRFRKEFASRKVCEAELERLAWLEAAGVDVPRVVERGPNHYVTQRIEGIPLDEWIRTRWATAPRAERTALIERCAAVCSKIRDAGLAWPDLVTYHLYLVPSGIVVIDPARVARGRLDLSALFWSTEEPTVSRTDRLRFWRRYAGAAKPPRIRRIGHRGRFRPYRWACQRIEIRPCAPWSRFVDGAGRGPAELHELAAKMRVKRTLDDRVNGVLDDLVIKITRDPDEAAREWENHRLLMAAGFRVPQPAYGGVLPDGRGFFSTVRLEGQHPVDDMAASLDRREIAHAAADIARRLHACGLAHSDLYLCHLFVEPGGDRLTLIDLARLRKTRSRRRRVKDLAALVSSARGLCSRTDLWRGLRRYGGDKRLARAIWKKALRMARHVPRNVKDGTHPPHVPCT